MDCCNFMPYRPPYYGTPYYDSMPYPADYYGHPYQDYYGSAPSYYGQPWHCTNSAFTDYVYNPKEARIRKAMREASRERALSVTPMSPRAVRRPVSVAAVPGGHAAWNFGNEEQLMMAPASHGMRAGIIASPMCGSSGFPIQAAGNGPFAMQSMHYNKHMHPITHSAGGAYMQANSLAPIPQQSDLWQPYEDPMRSTPGPYILPPQMSYPQTQSVPPPAILPPATQMEKNRLEQESFSHVEDSQGSHSNENVPPNNGDVDKMPMNEPVFESKVDSIQPLMDAGSMHNPATESFVQRYGDNVLPQTNGYEKNEAIKLKKPCIPPPRNNFKPSKKSLPDFNEAFGSTERGRFQRPPNSKGYLDYFLQDNDIHKFLEFQ